MPRRKTLILAQTMQKMWKIQMNETYELIQMMRSSEEELKTQELTPAMKNYMKSSDALICSMQAYIDYLLQDD
jgi:hypothetical protein